MNELSWMIYLAGMTDNFRLMLGLALGLGGFAAAFVAIMGALARHDYPEKSQWAKDYHARCVKFWWLPVVIALALSVTPSANTIYAIAASEMGEEIINSETGGKAMKALDAWLDRQIKGE